MKVLVIGSVYPRFQEDAEVPWLRTSIAHLKKAGVEIQVLAPAYKGLKSHDIDGTHVNRFRYAPASWEILTHEEGAPSKMASKPWLQLLAIPYIINGFFQCIRICRKWRPDVIHAHWPFPHAYIALGAAKLFRIPLVLNFHGAELLLIRKKKWVKPLLKFAIGQAQAVFANSSFTAGKIKAIRNVDVEWSPYGTTLETSRLQGECRNGKFICRYDRTAAPDAEGVKDEQLPVPHPVNGKFKILFVGRHIERKGICYLIEAAKYLPKDKFEIRIVGVGDLTEQLKQQAALLDERRKTRERNQHQSSSRASSRPKLSQTNTRRQTSLHFQLSSTIRATPKDSESCSSKPWNLDCRLSQAMSVASRMSLSTENPEFSFPRRTLSHLPMPSSASKQTRH